MDTPLPAVALVAESDLNRHLLRGVIEEAGYPLHCCIGPQQLERELAKPDAERVGVWLIDLAGDIPVALERIDECSPAPWLLNDDLPPPLDAEAHATWRRRLLEKLEEISPRGHGQGIGSTLAGVWILAASAGGPGAVREFIDALPAGLPVALVYVQHIDPGFDALLTDLQGREQRIAMTMCRGEHRLDAGCVSVLPSDREVRFLPHGRAIETRRDWEGRYRPAIDQVIAQLARLYGNRCGVIIFSGMCDDGAIGCRVAHAANAPVWVQTPASCINDDMPRAALATGAVSLQGSPAELAAALAARFGASNMGNTDERTVADPG